MNAQEIRDRQDAVRAWEQVCLDYFRSCEDDLFSMDGLWKWWGSQRGFEHHDSRLLALDMTLSAHEQHPPGGPS